MLKKPFKTHRRSMFGCSLYNNWSDGHDDEENNNQTTKFV